MENINLELPEVVRDDKGLIDLKATIKKPSHAIAFMIAGIDENIERNDFVINMMTFGTVWRDDAAKPFRVGCAAICTIQKIANKRFTPD